MSVARVEQRPLKFVAHRRESDGTIQEIRVHLSQVAESAARLAGKIGLGVSGELIGLLHDLGKYADGFQRYFDKDYPGGDKVDHSTAGAQFIWQTFASGDRIAHAIAQALALCVASHHGGMIDCLTPAGDDRFDARMRKPDTEVHLEEVQCKADAAILARARRLLGDPKLLAEFGERLRLICNTEKFAEATKWDCRARFVSGLLLRTLFSCLIDADRTDTADFENPFKAALRGSKSDADWDSLIDRLESRLRDFDDSSPVNDVRRRISEECHRAAERHQGVFTLTVPTGGGKTLASLRFALHHAKRWGYDRILYVVPYTTIIDQNAQDARDILEGDQGLASVVLEHHSNLTPDEETPKSRLLSENWDAPIIYTTMVQLLESLFGSGTRGARRLHALANAVIICDEVQALPVKTVHLFCNSVNFLVGHCGSTVVLCTATQPLLDRVNRQKGAVRLTPESEIIPDVTAHFERLRRVDVRDERRASTWRDQEIIDLADRSIGESGSCLLIVNTKRSALELYQLAKQRMPNVDVCHLSAAMCAAHRMDVLERMYRRIGHRGRQPVEPGPLLCVSTQLIEAGVDIDFGSVVRFVAGLDSIAQAAGRCNRHGKRQRGVLTIVNPADENLDKLDDIRLGRDAAVRVLDEFADDPGSLDDDLLKPAALERYFKYYFFARRDRMAYPVDVGHDDTLLNLLSENTCAHNEHKRRTGEWPKHYWRQSFKTAAESFNAIDAPTQGLIVPYGQDSQDLIGKLCATSDTAKLRGLLRKVQRYAVNVFPHILARLQKAGAVYEAQASTGIMYVDARYYSTEFGLDVDGQSEHPFLNA